MLSLDVKMKGKFSKKIVDHFLLPKNGFLYFRIRLMIKKSTLSDFSEFLLVGSRGIKGPTGNQMKSSKWPYLSPFKSYGHKTAVFDIFA